jgi:hypothetical protein
MQQNRVSDFRGHPQATPELYWRYRVTFDNTGKMEEIDGSTLAQEGLVIRPRADAASELLLFEAL